MTESYQPGDRVEVYFDAKFGEKEGWYAGMILRLDPYSKHRSFHWVKLDEDASAKVGVTQISVFNPKHLRKEIA